MKLDRQNSGHPALDNVKRKRNLSQSDMEELLEQLLNEDIDGLDNTQRLPEEISNTAQEARQKGKQADS